jgi:hypothetical protein
LIIGVDLDGTLSGAGLWNPSLTLPWWLFIFLVPMVFFMRPDAKAVRKINEMKDRGHKVIIISARPPWARAMTIRWLRLYRVPFDEVFCVGFGKGTGKRKLELIKREKIMHFFDDSRKIVEFLNHNSVEAEHL